MTPKNPRLVLLTGPRPPKDASYEERLLAVRKDREAPSLRLVTQGPPSRKAESDSEELRRASAQYDPSVKGCEIDSRSPCNKGAL